MLPECEKVVQLQEAKITNENTITPPFPVHGSSHCSKYNPKEQNSFINKCPVCGKNKSLLWNPEKTKEGEFTCKKCDTDFCPKSGFNKNNITYADIKNNGKNNRYFWKTVILVDRLKEIGGYTIRQHINAAGPDLIEVALANTLKKDPYTVDKFVARLYHEIGIRIEDIEERKGFGGTRPHLVIKYHLNSLIPTNYEIEKLCELIKKEKEVL